MGSWERDSFIQSGIRVTRLDDGSITHAFVEAARNVLMADDNFKKSSNSA